MLISSLFSLPFHIVCRSENRLKINITPYGDSFIIQNLKSGGVTFLKSFLPLRNFGMDFRVFGNNRNILDAFVFIHYILQTLQSVYLNFQSV